MSINLPLTQAAAGQYQTQLDALASAITLKGVDVPAGTKLSDLSSLVSQISGGAGIAFDMLVYPDTTTLLASTPAISVGIGVVPVVPATNWVASPAPLDSPTIGQVWIRTAASISFLPIYDSQGNNIFMPASIVRQWNGSAWITIPAYAWLDMQWQELTLSLYKLFDQCVPVTGGWAIGTAGSGSSVNFKNDGTVVLTTSGSSSYAIFKTQQPVDLTNYSTLSTDVICTDRYSGSTWLYVGISAASPTLANAPNPPSNAGYVRTNTINNSTPLMLSVASLSGPYYVWVYADRTSGILSRMYLSE